MIFSACNGIAIRPAIDTSALTDVPFDANACGLDELRRTVEQIKERVGEELFANGSCALSPDGKLLAISLTDDNIWIWQIDDMEIDPMILSGHTDWVSNLYFSPDGQKLISSAYHEVGIWDLSKPEPTATYFNGFSSSGTNNPAAFSPDGTRFAFYIMADIDRGGKDQIGLWDLTQAEPSMIRLQGHQEWIIDLAFSDDGTQFASADRSQTVLVRPINGENIDPSLISQRIKVPAVPEKISFLPGEISKLSVTGDHGEWQTVLDLNLSPTAPAPAAALNLHTDLIESIIFAPNGSQLISTDLSGTIRIWDLTSQPVSSKQLAWRDHEIRAIDLSADGSRLATAGRDAINIWDLAELETEPIEFRYVIETQDVAFMPAENYLITAGFSIPFNLHDLNDPGAIPTTIYGHQVRTFLI